MRTAMGCHGQLWSLMYNASTVRLASAAVHTKYSHGSGCTDRNHGLHGQQSIFYSLSVPCLPLNTLTLTATQSCAFSVSDTEERVTKPFALLDASTANPLTNQRRYSWQSLIAGQNHGDNRALSLVFDRAWDTCRGFCSSTNAYSIGSGLSPSKIYRSENLACLSRYWGYGSSLLDYDFGREDEICMSESKPVVRQTSHGSDKVLIKFDEADGNSPSINKDACQETAGDVRRLQAANAGRKAMGNSLFKLFPSGWFKAKTAPPGPRTSQIAMLARGLLVGVISIAAAQEDVCAMETGDSDDAVTGGKGSSKKSTPRRGSKPQASSETVSKAEMEGIVAALMSEYKETSRKEARLLMEELQSTKAQSLKLKEELQAVKDARVNTSHEKYNEKFDELKSLMSRTEATFTFDDSKPNPYKQREFYETVRKQLDLAAQFKGGQTLKRFIEVTQELGMAPMNDAMPSTVRNNPQLSVLWEAQSEAKSGSHAGSGSSSKSVVSSSNMMYSNAEIKKDVVVIEDTSDPLHPQNWDPATKRLDTKMYSMLETHWLKGPLFDHVLREMQKVSSKTYSYAITVAIQEIKSKSLIRIRKAAEDWVDPSRSLRFENASKFLDLWKKRRLEAREAKLTLNHIFGLHFLKAFGSKHESDPLYKAAVERFDAGFEDEDALDAWVEEMCTNWARFQAIDPSKGKQGGDKTALATQVAELTKKVESQSKQLHSKSATQKAKKDPKELPACSRCGFYAHKDPNTGKFVSDGSICYRTKHRDGHEITAPIENKAKNYKEEAQKKSAKKSAPAETKKDLKVAVASKRAMMTTQELNLELEKSNASVSNMNQRLTKAMATKKLSYEEANSLMGGQLEEAMKEKSDIEEALKVREMEALVVTVLPTPLSYQNPVVEILPKRSPPRGRGTLADSDESAHLSGSPFAQRKVPYGIESPVGDKPGVTKPNNRPMTDLENGLTEAFPDSPVAKVESPVPVSAANPAYCAVTVHKSVYAASKSHYKYKESRKPSVPYDKIKTCWISFFSGISPDAKFVREATAMGMMEKLDAFFAIETNEEARQIAMHMNPADEHFPGITYPMFKVEDFTEEWLLQLPKGSVIAVTFAAPCVDFSLMRLLRNYKGEIPDPVKARPGLDGPQGCLTRLSFRHWELITTYHVPTLIAENVPYLDLEDHWEESKSGWQSDPMLINSANHGYSHRRRAWWLTEAVPPSWLDLFGPLDFDDVLDDGWKLDPNSNCTLTAGWTRGTDEEPLQASERKMLIVSEVDGSERPPHVHEAEKMMSYPADATDAPGVTNRARLKALGNAWCYRTLWMIGTHLFGFSQEMALKGDPERYSKTVKSRDTKALATAKSLDGYDPDDEDDIASTVNYLRAEQPSILQALFETLSPEDRLDVESLATALRNRFVQDYGPKQMAMTTHTQSVKTDQDAGEYNEDLLDNCSEGTFDPNVVVEDPESICRIHGYTKGPPLMTEGKGYLPVEFYDDHNDEWFAYDIDDADKLVGPQTLIAEKHVRKDFRVEAGLCDEDVMLVSADGHRRVTLGEDDGGKRTIRWRLRTGSRAQRLQPKLALSTKRAYTATDETCDPTQDKPARQHGSMSKSDRDTVNFAADAKMHDGGSKTYAKESPTQSSSASQKPKTTPDGLRQAKPKGLIGVLNWQYLHEVLVHVSDPRRLWETFKRCVGVNVGKHPPPPINCNDCLKHKTHGTNLSHASHEKRREGLQRVQNERRKQSAQAMVSTTYEGELRRDEPYDGLNSDSDDSLDGNMDASVRGPSEEGEYDLHEPRGSEDRESDELDEGLMNMMGNLSFSEDIDATYGQGETANGDSSQDDMIKLLSIPDMPRFEDAKPLQYIFCDYKEYKADVYGQRQGEMMFADFKSNMRDVEAVQSNKRTHIYKAVTDFILRWKLDFINRNQYPVTIYGDGDGANKWVRKACRQFKIRYEPLPPRAQSLNMAEIMANHTWNAARTALSSSGLHSDYLLPFAIRTVVQRHYITATDAEREYKSPCEIITGKAPIIDLQRLPPFYTKCFVPSNKERRQELAKQMKATGRNYDWARAEQGRYLGNVDILSSTPRARLERTGRVVGAKFMKFVYGQHRHSDSLQPGNAKDTEIPTKIQVINGDTYQFVGLPEEICNEMPTETGMEVLLGTQRLTPQGSPIEEGDIVSHHNSLAGRMEEHEDDSIFEEVFPEDIERILKSSNRVDGGKQISQEEMVEAVKEMENNEPIVQVEAMRPIEEESRPKDWNHKDYSYEQGKEATNFLPRTRSQANAFTTSKGKDESDALHDSPEPIGQKVIKVYAVAREKIDEIQDPEYQALLQASLESWYCDQIDQLPHEKALRLEEVRAYEVSRVKNNDMSWKLIKTDLKMKALAIEARDKEINSLMKNILVHLSPENHDYNIAVKTATNCRMILCVKRDGTVKCRLVKQGFRENCSITDGPDFQYSSSVISLTTVRMVLSKSNLTGKTRVSLRDISTAFLQSHKYEKGQWKYCKWRDDLTGELHYYRQLAPIYGEKSAPKRWQETLFPFMESLGFDPGCNEKSLFYHADRDLIVLIYVDDCLAVGDEEDIKWFWSVLGERFQCKDTEWLSEDSPLDYLGMEVSLTAEYLYIGMQDYIEKMVEQLGIKILPEKSCRVAISAPINEDGTDTPLSPEERHEFLSALGQTGWLNCTARPDISYAQSRIAQHAANPTKEAWAAVVHLVSYLYHTRSLQIRASLRHTTKEMELLQRVTENSDTAWSFHSDTDHAGNREVQNKRRSQNSRICCQNGMPVDWKSTVKTYATATREITEAHADVSSGAAEIYGASTATMDILGLRYIAEEAHIPFPRPVELQVDNSTAKAFADDSVLKTKLKHIDCRQEWVRILRDHRLFRLIHCPTDNNVADLGTKILATGIFIRLREMIMFLKE